ncbi:MAG: hypothetical protein VZQ98_14450 [Bacteroidales bacterium]|nr:hypothetical protein [Bacteroidales bacterium]
MRKRCRTSIFTIIIVAIGLVWSAYNIFVIGDCKTFFGANLFQILTIMVAIVISFYISQRITDRRRKADVIEKMLYIIQDRLSNKDIILSSKREVSLPALREVENNLKYLTEHCFSGQKDDFKILNDKFEVLRGLFDESFMQESRLNELKPKMVSAISVINSKCNEIILKMNDD